MSLRRANPGSVAARIAVPAVAWIRVSLTGERPDGYNQIDCLRMFLAEVLRSVRGGETGNDVYRASQSNIYRLVNIKKNRMNSCPTGSTNFSFTGREFRAYVTWVRYRGFLKSSGNRRRRASAQVVSPALISLSEMFRATSLCIVSRQAKR